MIGHNVPASKGEGATKFATVNLLPPFPLTPNRYRPASEPRLYKRKDIYFPAPLQPQTKA